MNVELSRYKVKKGKSALVDEWLTFLRTHMDEVLLTLQDEKMYVETIFRERVGDDEFLYWYSVQGERGMSVEQSAHAVDQQYLTYWAACIDETYGNMDLETAVVMIAPSVRTAMEKEA